MMKAWHTDLSDRLSRISQVATGGCDLRVVVPGARLALALPPRRDAAALVCALYQPQRMAGRILKCAIKAGLLTGGLRLVAKTWRPTVTNEPEATWLASAAAAGSVGFLGCNPNHGLRCVLAGIILESGAPFVAKLGFDDAAEAIRREYEMLAAIHPRFPGIVQPHGFEAGSDWAMLRLPYLGNQSPKRITEPAVMALLESWVQDTTCDLGENPWASALLERLPPDQQSWGEAMRQRTVANALMHGDFAVWNLRVGEYCLGGGDLLGQDDPETDWDKMSQLQGGNTGLVAIDWEWAEVDGIAGIDLVHALRQEAYMVRRLQPAKAIAWMRNEMRLPMCRDYLERAGWGDAENDLLRLGLLHSHFNAANDSQALLVELGLKV